jgi:hypothetical protein
MFRPRFNYFINENRIKKTHHLYKQIRELNLHSFSREEKLRKRLSFNNVNTNKNTLSNINVFNPLVKKRKPHTFFILFYLLTITIEIFNKFVSFNYI